MQEIPRELADHPDRRGWNAKYESASTPLFAPHELAIKALSLPLPDGPVLDLACGPSGSALYAAAAGHPVTAADVSEVALDLLAGEAGRRGLRDLITLVHTDLGTWQPEPGHALVLCTGFWARPVFEAALEAVAPGGLLAWEAFTTEAQRVRPGLPDEWCLGPDEPASLLTSGFSVLEQHDVQDGRRRRLLARRG